MKLFKKSDDGDGDFITYPLTLETYKWYKPILILVLATVIYMLVASFFSGVLEALIPGSTKSMAGQVNPYTANGLYTIFTVAIVSPAIYIATRIIYKIPLSKQLSPIRGWNWGLFLKSVFIVLVVYAVYVFMEILITGKTIVNHFTLITFILCLILTPFQGFAEEFLCRGFLMQTIGSWIKIPIIAIILQALIFTAPHVQYNIIGLISVLAFGLISGFVTYYTKGLEVSSAIHMINNLNSFLLMGLGLESVTGDIGLGSVIINLILIILPLVIIWYLEKNYNWFGLNKTEQ